MYQSVEFRYMIFKTLVQNILNLLLKRGSSISIVNLFTLLLTLKFLIGKKMTLKTETLANMETKYILCTATSI